MARALIPLHPLRPLVADDVDVDRGDISESQKHFLAMLQKGIYAELKDFRADLLRDIRVEINSAFFLKKAAYSVKTLKVRDPDVEGSPHAGSPRDGNNSPSEGHAGSSRDGNSTPHSWTTRIPKIGGRKALRKNKTEDLKKTCSVQHCAEAAELLLDPEGASSCLLDAEREADMIGLGGTLQSQLVLDEVHELTEDSFDWKKRALGIIETCICFVIIFNAVVIGLEIDFRARNYHESPPLLYHILDKMFFVLFFIELSFRLYVHGRSFFWMTDFAWNWFDFILVVFQAIDIVMSHQARGSSNHSSGVRVLRVFRILRLARVTRILRVFRLVDDLRNIMASIASSLKTLFWTMLLICAMVFITAIALTQTVVEAADADEEKSDLEIYGHFGTVGTSALTLYKCISDGLHWGEVFDVVVEDSLITVGVILVIYISFCLFALLNVVTAVFVEKAFDGAQADRDERLAANLVNVFTVGDRNASETEITWPDFEKNTSSAEVREYLKEIDIAETEAEGLFTLLDTDGSGTISLVELVSGCTRLRGSAKAIQLALHMTESRHFHSRVMDRIMMIQSNVTRIADAMSLSRQVS